MFEQIEVLLSDCECVEYLNGSIYGSLARSAAIGAVSVYLWELEKTHEGTRFTEEGLERLRLRESEAEEYLAWTMTRCPEVLLPDPTEVVDWLYGNRFESGRANQLDELRIRTLSDQLGDAFDRSLLERRVAEQRQAQYEFAQTRRSSLISRLSSAMGCIPSEEYAPPLRRQSKILDTAVRKLEERKLASLAKVLARTYVEESIADIHLIEPMLKRAAVLSRRLVQELNSSTDPTQGQLH